MERNTLNSGAGSSSHNFPDAIRFLVEDCAFRSWALMCSKCRLWPAGGSGSSDDTSHSTSLTSSATGTGMLGRAASAIGAGIEDDLRCARRGLDTRCLREARAASSIAIWALVLRVRFFLSFPRVLLSDCSVDIAPYSTELHSRNDELARWHLAVASTGDSHRAHPEGWRFPPCAPRALAIPWESRASTPKT